jgi:hypothetical protein
MKGPLFYLAFMKGNGKKTQKQPLDIDDQLKRLGARINN